MERSETEALPAGTLIGERYRVTRVLGRGGMAVVYECRDEANNQLVALKQLEASRSRDEHLVRLFELEYHTLAQLAHPRVIEVYDYHTSSTSPFYTMELLEGDDLRPQDALLPWMTVCQILCDVCSALSLVHSRRFVHRDVTPRNIRRTRDGKVKLIDFGAMVPFGTHKRTVGTPAFTAPEAVTGQPLDGRTDLFSLGATAYYALTGRHAYPARSFDHLRNLWRSQPALPSRYVPDIPPDLDQLVMWLLQLAPSRRPASAAAVMERLTAISGLQLDEQLQLQQAFLATPSLVGRDKVLQQVRRQVLLASRGRGGTALITGASGVGRSRMVDACALEGKLANAVVLRADAGDAQGGDWGGVCALLDQLLTELPAKAIDLMTPVASVLTHVWPRASELTGVPARVFDDPNELRPTLQSSLLSLMEAVTRCAFLMITADDLERVDEPTRAFLALLAQQVTGRRALLVTAAVSGSLGQAASERVLLQNTSAKYELAALSPGETELLLLSVFGEVPNVRMLASRLHPVARGLPAATMQLTQHLLDSQVLGFRDGGWLLPSKLDGDALPSSISAALQARLRELDDASSMLAQAIALSRKPAVTLEECACLASAPVLGPAASGRPQLRGVLDLLDELSRAGVIENIGERFALRPGWTAVLVSESERDRSRELQARLAQLFMREPEAEFRAAAHLFAADQDGAAIDQVLRYRERTTPELAARPARLPEYLQALPSDWMSTLDAAVAAADRLGRSRRQRLGLRQLILQLPIASRPRPDIVRELMQQLYVDTGLSDYAELDAALPATERITRALQAAQTRYQATAEHERGLPPSEAITVLAIAVLQTIAMMSPAADVAFMESLPSLAPYAPLSGALVMVQHNLECTCHLISGRLAQAHAGYAEILAQLTSAEGLGLLPGARRYMELSITYALASIELLGGKFSAAAPRIDVLERDPLFEVGAWRLRMMQALRQGNIEDAGVCERKAELVRIRNPPAQFFENSQDWYETAAHIEIGDVARVRQAVERLNAVAKKYETWAVTPLVAHAQIARLRGESATAVEYFEQAIAKAGLNLLLSRATAARGYLIALAECGRIDEARSCSVELFERVRAGQMTAQIGELHFAMASVELSAGDHAAALAQLEALAKVRETWPGGDVFGGATHELRARVAIAMADEPAFQAAAQACWNIFLASGHPILIARHARLLQDAERAGLHVPQAQTTRARDDCDQSTAADRGTTQVERKLVLEDCVSPKARVERVLSLLSDPRGSGHAMLYLLRERAPVCVGARGAHPDIARVNGLVERFLREELEAASQSSATIIDADDLVTSTVDGNEWVGPTGIQFAPALLSHNTRENVAISGVVVFDIESQRRPDDELLAQLSAALTAAGDVEPIRP